MDDTAIIERWRELVARRVEIESGFLRSSPPRGEWLDRHSSEWSSVVEELESLEDVMIEKAKELARRSARLLQPDPMGHPVRGSRNSIPTA